MSSWLSASVTPIYGWSEALPITAGKRELTTTWKSWQQMSDVISLVCLGTR